MRPDDLDALTVRVSELLVATADGHDAAVDRAVPEVLQALRQKLGMDVVFVSEFVDGERVFRFVDGKPDAPRLEVGDSGPLEESYCQRVVDGRLPEMVGDVTKLPPGTVPPPPFRIGAHLSTPIVMPDGNTYGTLCCFSAAPNDHLRRKDLETLRMCAQLVARKVDAAVAVKETPNWTIAPVEPRRR